jgi:molecular chaperone DnaK (HSP70)
MWHSSLYAAITTVNNAFMVGSRFRFRFRSKRAQQKAKDSDLLDFSDTESGFLSPQRDEGATRSRLVVGIDFGTTYFNPLLKFIKLLTFTRFSGASFALLHPRDDPSEVKISPVRNWKGDLPGNTTSNKVPTVIAYDAVGKVYWGFDALDELREETYRWLKLLLEPEVSGKRNLSDAVDQKATKVLLSSQSKTAIDVAADYVRLLWEHVKDQIINEHSKATYDFAEKSIVFTVPAVWSEMAKHNTYLVAVGAGLALENLRLQTISEPEAAAIAVLRDRGTLLKVTHLRCPV